ncbi:hypothetical protein [Antrihabitans sp. YC2-6]|uniref:hypothetical protein n=1 Tax=Antrihabitans sp. YC2-6 TaxID=2799498 RepID=UPI0018F49EA9|nr:hypothetical protein [Antrihabitans sp. YC2-6]MBJ8344641.1 hypothetical protein [Antrihabitans sp. YC2-6]
MASADELVFFTNRIREDLDRSGQSATDIELVERLRYAVDQATAGDSQLPLETRDALVARYGEPG